MSTSKIDLLKVVSAHFDENAFILRRSDRDDCLVIDPGLEPDKIVREIKAHGLTPAAILVTHGHSDHIGGIGVLKQQWPDCPILIGEADADKLTDPGKNLSAAYGVPIMVPAADRLLNDGDLIEEAGIRLEARTIPGHSIGHVVYVCQEETPPFVLVGDVIFAGSVGRTDFSDGDFPQLAAGIHRKLFSLPKETVLHPGHGPATTVGNEKEHNPYVGSSRWNEAEE